MAQRKEDAVQKKAASEPNKTGLPDNLKAGIENLSGYSMDDVKVHYNSSQPAGLQAHAYAQGTDIHVAPGQERHLPHEAWHVVQQKQGRVQPTRQLKGKTPVNDDAGLEKEADTMGGQALQAKAAEPEKMKHPAVSFAASRSTVQGRFYDENGEPVQEPVLKQVEAYIKDEAGELLKEFRQEAKKEKTEVSLNTWTVGALGVSVMEILQTESENKKELKKQKPEKGFSFEEKGRRIYTHYQGEKHKNTNFHKLKHQLNKEEGTDFSYKHVRTIMENVLKAYPFLTIDDINNALKEGIKNFDPKAKQIKLSGNVNVDLQLLAQHLLRYQSFNRGQLQDKEENREENKFRMLEMEKSKRMLVSSSSRKDLDRLVPPTPDQKKGKGLRDAMPGLIDLNRPLENSIFSQETYKAVFLLAHKTFREAHDLSQEEFKEQKKKKPQIDEEIDMQRSFFNEGMFNVIANMENSEEERDGKEFITNHLGFNYDSENDSFDEDGYSSSDSDEELSDDSEIYDSDDDLFTAKEKRNVTVNSFGLFSKVSAQKELLDKTEKRKKHEKIRRKINRRSVKLTDKYEERFETIVKESQYVDKKQKSLDSLEQNLDQEMGILDVLVEGEAQTGDSQILRSVGKNNTDEISKKIRSFNVKTKGMRGNTKKYKEELTEFKKGFKKKDIRERRKSVGESKERLEELRTELNEFYESQKIGDIVRKRKKPGNWRNKQNQALFMVLGPQKMNDFIYEGITPEIKPKKKANLKRKPTSPRDKKPTKKKKTE